MSTPGVPSVLALLGAAGGLAVLGAVTPWLAAAGYAHRFTRTVQTLDELPTAEVALVPGAYIRADGSPGVHLTARLELALAAYRAGTVPAVLVSGGHPPGAGDEPTVMRRWLLDHGIGDDRIIVDRHGDTTYHSLRRAQLVFGIGSMIICSQDYHLPRAVTTARLLGLDAWGLGESRIRREHPRTSRNGIVRELGAAVKMLRDVAIHPDVPSDGDRDAADRALGRRSSPPA